MGTTQVRPWLRRLRSSEQLLHCAVAIGSEIGGSGWVQGPGADEWHLDPAAADETVALLTTVMRRSRDVHRRVWAGAFAAEVLLNAGRLDEANELARTIEVPRTGVPAHDSTTFFHLRSLAGEFERRESHDAAAALYLAAVTVAPKIQDRMLAWRCGSDALRAGGHAEAAEAHDRQTSEAAGRWLAGGPAAGSTAVSEHGPAPSRRHSGHPRRGRHRSRQTATVADIAAGPLPIWSSGARQLT